VNAQALFQRLPMPIRPKLPGFAGATDWLNSEPLTREDLQGKVVLADFWTFTCINWIRTLPYVRAWAETYGPHGLIVVGVHTPEFSIEHDLSSIRMAARDLGVVYPIAVDNDYVVWDAFANQFWPALYLADSSGRIRHQHFGEGGYERSERMIRRLLLDAGAVGLPDEAAPVRVKDIEIAADPSPLRSPETYVGTARSRGFTAAGANPLGTSSRYIAPDRLRPHEWSLEGTWTIGLDRATVDEQGGRIKYRFRARDVNLILARPEGGGPVRFLVSLDGEAPGDAHGLDVDADGSGVVDAARLYQLIRQAAVSDDRLFEIEFLDPGAAAFCFTFG